MNHSSVLANFPSKKKLINYKFNENDELVRKFTEEDEKNRKENKIPLTQVLKSSKPLSFDFNISSSNKPITKQLEPKNKSKHSRDSDVSYGFEYRKPLLTETNQISSSRNKKMPLIFENVPVKLNLNKSVRCKIINLNSF